MTLTQLRYFVAIADSGLNITLAAERVHATQPGLSKQLKQLEDELGFLLFQRKGRSLEAITPAGQDVLAHARRVLAEAGNIRAYAANERGEKQGRLTLVTTHTQARFVLPETLARFRQRYPDVALHMHQGTPIQISELAADGISEWLERVAVQAKPQSPPIDHGLVPRSDDTSTAALFLALPGLAGNKTVLQKARELFVALPAAQAAVDQLDQVAQVIEQRYPNAELYFDLGELRGYHYHTGVVFAAF